MFKRDLENKFVLKKKSKEKLSTQSNQVPLLSFLAKFILKSDENKEEWLEIAKTI